MTRSSELATPVRALGTAEPSGARLLRDVSLPYRDGAEQAVLEIISAATDLRSSSVEMLLSARGWAQRYHLDPTRANIVRGLALPADARVLEIGAGCGAITRHLGERCEVVDALEPVPSRAAAAAARTRDLDGVQVFVGELDDIPDVACYDVVVVIGVLEYVGNGTADRTPYLDFLRKIRERLVDDGTLVLAIENQLGVKYLVGAPEDHTGRVFDGLENYPRGGPARTFPRRALEQLMRDAGLEPTTRVAFPDYKMTRAVLGDVPEDARSLLHRIPRFPSPTWQGARARLADEYSLWRSLVEAGLETEFGNSFLVTASKAAGGDPVWPADQLAVFYTSDRRPQFNMQTVVRTRDGVVHFTRAPLVPDAAADAAAQGADLRVAASDHPFQDGRDLTAVLAEEGVAAFADHAGQWLGLVDAAMDVDAGSAIDVVPHNLIVTDRGELQVIDVELIDSTITRDRVVRRGVFCLAVRATPFAAAEHWLPATTIGEVACELGAYVGLPADGSWLAQTITEEADFLTRVRPGPRVGVDADTWRAELEKELWSTARRPLVQQPLGDRLPDQFRRISAEAKDARLSVERLQRQLKQAKAARRKSRSRTRRAVARLVPRGSRRRALADRLRGRRPSR